MKNINPLYIFLCLSIVLASCKDNNKSAQDQTENTQAVDQSNYNLISNEEYSAEEIKELNNSASSIVEHRIEQDSNIWAHIEYNVWEYEFVFQNGEMSEQGDYAGYWIDMEIGHKYTYGIKGEKLGSGRYHYSPHTELLLLVDDNPNVKPRQYRAKITGQMMVLAGNPEYRDNGFQSKLVRVSSIPE